MGCTRFVFRCFKCLERGADCITGAAGPFFIATACILLSLGTFAFFEVIAPTLSFQLITVPICILFASNMFANYYYVCTVPPGFVDDAPNTLTTREGHGLTWARKRQKQDGVTWTDEPKLSDPIYNKCNRCGLSRPERSHHCKICKRCVLKFDHHCPVWINQCVGIHNERYFVLFMAWLIVCSFCFFTLGWPTFWESFDYYKEWKHSTPSVVFLLEYILAVVICLALFVMCGWHLWSIAQGETSVDNHDFDAYRRLTKSRGQIFENCYDLGYRKNLELFFNVGPGGYPLYALFLPFRTAPYTDGFRWAKREGMVTHAGIKDEEHYTDEGE